MYSKDNLSKSLFIKGTQCQKALWLTKHKKHLQTPPDDSTKALFEQGNMVGKFARQLYPNGEEITFKMPFREKFTKTQSLIETKCPNIYEATIQYNGILCMVDILHHTAEGWDIIEVKSSTSEKEVNIQDIAIQYYILTGSKLKVRNAYLMYINNGYSRNKSLNLTELFTISDVTEQVLDKQAQIETTHTELKRVINTNQEPDIPIGPQCTSPYDCDFKEYCWQHIPDYSIFNLAGMSASDKFELYYQGIHHIDAIPSHIVLGEKQKSQIECELSQKRLINKEKVNQFLNQLFYPLIFFDFESFQTPIPPFDGIRPYQQIPFQYSIHQLNSPFDTLSHKEFIANPGTDPREQLIKRMIKDIPKNSCVIVYNAKFEQKIIRELSESHPKYKDDLIHIHDNIVDLMIPFKEKSIYFPEMRGSYSIKAVLPALVPGMSYDDLEIKNGGQATLSYSQLSNEPKEKQTQVINALLEYCKQDTLAMVKILEKMRELI